MKESQSSRNRGHSAPGITTASDLGKALLLWGVMLAAVWISYAQPTSQAATPQVNSAQAKPALTAPTSLPSAPASALTTNVPTNEIEKLLLFEPLSLSGSSLGSTIIEPKADELTLRGYTYSGIIMQFIQAQNPLQLLNPAAPSLYGSGWGNLQLLPSTSASNPMLKLFSFGF